MGLDEGAVEVGRQSRGEEIANSVTHGVGMVLAMAGLAVIAFSASRYGTDARRRGLRRLRSGAVVLYSSSTLYHSGARARPREGACSA